MAFARSTQMVAVTVLTLSCLAVCVQGLNITQILEPYPNYSLFNQWLSITGVADEINNRTSLTVLAPSNDVLQGYVSGGQTTKTLADTLRYQILLTYFGWPELEMIAVLNYTEVTTLLQTTGRSNDSQGFVKIYNTGSQFVVGHLMLDTFGNETIIGNVTVSPYDYSVFQISSLLVPLPPSPAPGPSPVASKTVVPVAAPAGPLTSLAPGAGAPTGSEVAAGPIDSVGNFAGPLSSFSKPLVVLGILFAYSAALL